MAGNHDAYIIEVGGEFLVRPAVIMSDASQKLKFRNLTNYPAMLIFPSDFIDEGSPISIDKMDATGGGKDKVKVTIAALVPDGNYSYTVIVVKGGSPVAAKGESAPSIIVDR